MSFARFDVQNIKCHFLEYSCETVCPLDNESRERMDPKTCYCDTLCLELGDCCYDYFSRLVAKITFLRVMYILQNLDTKNNLRLSILQITYQISVSLVHVVTYLPTAESVNLPIYLSANLTL